MEYRKKPLVEKVFSLIPIIMGFGLFGLLLFMLAN